MDGGCVLAYSWLCAHESLSGQFGTIRVAGIDAVLALCKAAGCCTIALAPARNKSWWFLSPRTTDLVKSMA